MLEKQLVRLYCMSCFYLHIPTARDTLPSPNIDCVKNVLSFILYSLPILLIRAGNMANLDQRSSRKRAYPTWVEMSQPQDLKRTEVEQYIHACFHRAYGADVQQFMPTLMSLRSDAGDLLGALGLRQAKNNKLFLEQYLSWPVEQLLAAKINSSVARDGIVEVGNLAVSGAGGGRWLITALTAYLYASREKWVVFTAGPVLCNAFCRLGIDLIELGDADPTRLHPNELSAWGSYYDQKPKVMAGRVEPGYRKLQKQLQGQSALARLWLNAGEAGSIAA
jgi:hypothetical protein